MHIKIDGCLHSLKTADYTAGVWCRPTRLCALTCLWLSSVIHGSGHSKAAASAVDRCCPGWQDSCWNHLVLNLTGLQGCCWQIALASLGAPGRCWYCSFAGCGMASWATYWRSFHTIAKAVAWPGDPLTDARCLTKEKTCSSLCPDTCFKVKISDSHCCRAGSNH